MKQPKRQMIRPEEAVAVGQSVTHTIYGEGVVLSVEEVEFKGDGIKSYRDSLGRVLDTKKVIKTYQQGIIQTDDGERVFRTGELTCQK